MACRISNGASMMDLPIEHILKVVGLIGGPAAGIFGAVKAGLKAYNAQVQKAAAQMEQKRLAEQAKETVAAKNRELDAKDKEIAEQYEEIKWLRSLVGRPEQ